MIECGRRAHRRAGFVLAPVLVLTSLAAVIAVGAATRAQVDTRLAAQAASAAQADIAAAGLLDALLEDLAAQLRHRSLATSTGAVCVDVERCAGDYPRVAAGLGRIPGRLRTGLALLDLSDAAPVYLAEKHGVGHGLHRVRLFEARVEIHGAAEAALAATFAAVEPRVPAAPARR